MLPRSHRSVCRFVSCLVLGLTVAVLARQPAFAAEPRRELWQLVSKDAGLAIEARDLSTKVRQFLGSELFQRIQRHHAWQQLLGSSEIGHLREIAQTIKDTTQHSMPDWLDKLFGEDVLLTITPRAGQRPRLVLLTRLRNPGDLPEILAAWDKLEPRNQTRLEHRGQEFFRRVKPNQPDEPLYFTLIDDVFVVSDQPESLTAVIDLTGGATADSLWTTTNFQKLRQAMHPDSSVRMLIQPAAWKQAQEATPSPPKDIVEQWIHQGLANCQSIGIGVRLESGIVAEIVARSDELAQQGRWQKLVEKTAGSPEFLTRVPKTAVLAIGGRHDLAGVADWVLSQTPPDQLKKLKGVRQVIRGILLGADLFEDVLPRLPADFGAYLIPRDNQPADTVPVDGLVAIALPARESAADTDSAKRPAIRSVIDNALRTGMGMLAAMRNATVTEEVTLEEAEHHGVQIHWLDHFGPISPAYAIAPDYCVIASSPQMIRDYLDQAPSTTWGSDEQLRQLKNSSFADAGQVMALQGRQIRQFMQQHRDFLLKQLQAAHKIKPEEAGKRLDRMLEWMQLSDLVVLGGSFHSDHVKLVLAIVVTESQSKVE